MEIIIMAPHTRAYQQLFPLDSGKWAEERIPVIQDWIFLKVNIYFYLFCVIILAMLPIPHPFLLSVAENWFLKTTFLDSIVYSLPLTIYILSAKVVGDWSGVRAARLILSLSA